MEINFESEGFPAAGPVRNGFSTLSTTWDDLLWSAITVGRPNRHFVFQYGIASLYEALFRVSALRMSLEQLAPGTRRFRRTQAAKNLDPSEKGAINYFLGLTLCKLFAEMQLDAPWLLHLDVFRAQLNPTLLSGRSRPDLVGLTRSGAWVAIESKGRVSAPSPDSKVKAKEQAERLISVGGTPVTYRIGAFAYFRNDVLRFFWRDPQPDGTEPSNSIRLNVTEDEIWRRYYQPVVELVGQQLATSAPRESAELTVEQADLKVRVVPEVMKLLRLEKWKEAGHWCMEHKATLTRAEAHGDGIQIIAGQSWSARFDEMVAEL
jgi:hypothetical protein